jgi:hypothetical protein
MKLPLLIQACVFCAAAVSGFLLPQVATPAATPDIREVSVFEGGIRYQAGEYPVLVLNGTFREMGRQYGALMRDELVSEHMMIIGSLEKRGIARSEIRAGGYNFSAFQPERLKEISRGIAETSGLSYENVCVLCDGPIFAG